MIILQVWESIPNHLPKLSRPPSLADVHFPHYSDLPKPDLAKKLNSLHAHFSALPKTLKTLNSGNTEASSNAVKMEGVAAKLKRRGWCGCLRSLRCLRCRVCGLNNRSKGEFFSWNAIPRDIYIYI